MSVASYLRDRGLAVAIVATGVALACSYGLMLWLGPAPTTHDFVGPPRSGYVLRNFTMWAYDVNGLPNFRMVSPHLERREGDESLYINTPKFLIPSKKPGIPDWDGDSLYAWVDKAGDLLKLQGPVYMHRPAYIDPKGTPTPETIMHTSEVTAWPKENRMLTAEPAKIVQGARTMSGIGMRASLDNNHLELLDASHITFPPRAPKQPAAARSAPARPAHPAAGAGQTG